MATSGRRRVLRQVAALTAAALTLAGCAGARPPGPESVGVVDLASGEWRVLLAPASQPAWSPDGSRIAVVSRGGAPAIELLRPDGSGRTPLRRIGRASTAAVSWAPDGDRLAACVSTPEAPGTPLRLLVVGIPGGRWRTVHETSQRRIGCDPPAWAPGGRRVALAAQPEGPRRPGREVVVVDPAEGSSRVVSPSPADEDGVTWLAGGDALLATARPSSGRGLVQVVPLHGARRTLVSGAHGQATASPDGRRVAALVVAPDLRVRPVVHASDGRLLTRIDLEGRRLSWSPDGRALAIGAREGLFLWSVADGALRRLARLEQPVVTAITWAPDGRRLAVSWFREGRGD